MKGKKTTALVMIYLCIMQMGIGQFYFGSDLSYVNEMEFCDAGYAVDDMATDPFQIFADHGSNLVRVRLWHTPSWYDDLSQGMRFSDFNDVNHSIQRAHQSGMDVLLDFHLSDTWADPSRQIAPAAWTSVLNSLPVLQDSLYNYIYITLHQLAQHGDLPKIVQIGNETNRGILLSQAQNDQGWTLDWSRNSALFNTAIDAVHAIELLHQQDIKIALHIADPDAVAWYMDQFHDYGVTDFDIIGMSYYWQWHEMTFSAVGDVIASLKETYPDKHVMILETAYPWTTINAD
ncbi:MAG: glycosyl hydrolase 53 family protein, partial [Saprospiraceae bacterium]